MDKKQETRKKGPHKDISSELYGLFFEYSNDAQYVLDRKTGRYLLVNAAFERITGYTKEELLSGNLSHLDLVDPRYHKRVELLDNPAKRIRSDRFEVEIVQHSGRRRHVEITIHNITLGKRRLRVGSLRNIGRRKRLQKQLEHQIDLQRKRNIELAKSNLRIYQLTEKLRNAPKFASDLLAADDEEELLKRATRMLTDKNGLNYKDVVFYMKAGDYLVPKSWTTKVEDKRVSIRDNNRLARILRGGGEKVRTKPGEELIPLQGRKRLIGVLQVFFDEDERLLFAGSGTVKAEQKNILITLADIMALTIANLRLFKQVQKQSVVDQLTGVHNRRYYDRKIVQEIERVQRYGRDLSLMYLDMDNLKEINDEFGHDQGDLVLREIARLARESSRRIDVVCRWGGDEFILILPETSIEEAQAKAETLRSLIADYPFPRIGAGPGDEPVSASVSVGVANLDHDETNPGALFKKVDKATYMAKQKGKNRVEVYGSAEQDS
jgi:diguanylate cyclase (GGDEF)-like protein/PAS domain S-box-containing protein